MSLVHWVALTTGARIGGKTLTRLLTRFGNLPAIFNASPAELREVSGVGEKTAAAIAAIDLSHVEAEIKGWSAQGIRAMTWEDADYPANLLRCEDAPPVLFAHGKLLESDSRAVAIVGTRQASPEFLDFAKEMAGELARRGWTIVSGLALGIDTAAHQGTLEAGGRTLAVLGSGLQRVYPDSNQPLAARVAERGALLSELHPAATVSPQTLIARNRITSGLSRAVIVAQTGIKGGSMSAAHQAISQGRPVLAVRGGGEGCEDLIQRGAQIIEASAIDWDALGMQIDASMA